MSLHLQRLRSNWLTYLKARVLPSSGVESHCLSDTGKGFRISLTHCLKSLSVLIRYSSAVFLKELKCNVQQGEFIVLCDFEENNLFCKMKLRVFTGIISSLNPFLIYFSSSTTMICVHDNLIIISSCLKHNTT